PRSAAAAAALGAAALHGALRGPQLLQRHQLEGHGDPGNRRAHDSQREAAHARPQLGHVPQAPVWLQATFGHACARHGSRQELGPGHLLRGRVLPAEPHRLRPLPPAGRLGHGDGVRERGLAR
ncbi:unnamed protein product, partial [Effrenium voratum]